MLQTLRTTSVLGLIWACGGAEGVLIDVSSVDAGDGISANSAQCSELVCATGNEASTNDVYDANVPAIEPDAADAEGMADATVPSDGTAPIDASVSEGSAPSDASSSTMDGGAPDASDGSGGATSACTDGECSAACPCDEGDVCASDAACKGRLRCGSANGAKFGRAAAVHVCEDPCTRPRKSGVLGVYRDAQDQIVHVRGDGVVDFNWSTGTPSTAIAPGDFRAVWEGQIEGDVAGSYSLCVENTKPGDVVNMSLTAGGGSRTGPGCIGPISLAVGARASFSLDYKHYGAGAASVRLTWKRPGETFTRIVPRSAFAIDGGDGLDAAYYAPSIVRSAMIGSMPKPIALPTTMHVDTAVATHLGARTPDGALYRWTGQVQAAEAGSYRICARTDAIADQSELAVIGSATVSGQGCTAPIALAAGERRTVRLDYVHGAGEFGVTLEWRRPGMFLNETIPSSALFTITRPCECAPDGTCNETKCSAGSKCLVGQGPCTAHDDCAPGTLCRNAEGSHFGLLPDTNVCVDPCVNATGGGANAEFFAGGTIDAPTTLVTARREPTLAFDWSTVPPSPGMSTAGMVARFSANVRPDVSALYEICVIAPSAQDARLTVGPSTQLLGAGCTTMSLDGMRLYPMVAALRAGAGTSFSVTWRSSTDPTPVALTRAFLFTGTGCAQ